MDKLREILSKPKNEVENMVKNGEFFLLDTKEIPFNINSVGFNIKFTFVEKIYIIDKNYKIINVFNKIKNTDTHAKYKDNNGVEETIGYNIEPVYFTKSLFHSIISNMKSNDKLLCIQNKI